jgi:hypothetical protein
MPAIPPAPWRRTRPRRISRSRKAVVILTFRVGGAFPPILRSTVPSSGLCSKFRVQCSSNLELRTSNFAP